MFTIVCKNTIFVEFVFKIKKIEIINQKFTVMLNLCLAIEQKIVQL